MTQHTVDRKQVALRRWYTATYKGTKAFVNIRAAGPAADREVATLTKLGALPQCRVVRLLHAARVTLVDPATMRGGVPHVALVTEYAPGNAFKSSSDLSTALELLEVRVSVTSAVPSHRTKYCIQKLAKRARSLPYCLTCWCADDCRLWQRCMR